MKFRKNWKTRKFSCEPEIKITMSSEEFHKFNSLLMTVDNHQECHVVDNEGDGYTEDDTSITAVLKEGIRLAWNEPGKTHEVK